MCTTDSAYTVLAKIRFCQVIKSIHAPRQAHKNVSLFLHMASNFCHLVQPFNIDHVGHVRRLCLAHSHNIGTGPTSGLVLSATIHYCPTFSLITAHSSLHKWPMLPPYFRHCHKCKPGYLSTAHVKVHK